MHHILSRDAGALKKVQKLTLQFVKGLRNVPVEAALQQLLLFSLPHWQIRGDLISMFKTTHGLLETPMGSTVAHPTRKRLRGHTYKFHQQRGCTRRRQYAFTIWAVPSPVKSFKISMDSHWQSLFPQHILTRIKSSHPNDPFHIPHHPTLSLIIVRTAL